MKKAIAIAVVLGLLAGACSSDASTDATVQEPTGTDNVGGDTTPETTTPGTTAPEETASTQGSEQPEDGSVPTSGIDLPEGFPVPIPSGGAGTWTGVSADNGAASLTYPPGSFEEVEAFYADWAAGMGDDLLSSETGDEPTFAAWAVQTQTHYITVTVQDNQAEVTVAVYVSP